MCIKGSFLKEGNLVTFDTPSFCYYTDRTLINILSIQL